MLHSLQRLLHPQTPCLDTEQCLLSQAKALPLHRLYWHYHYQKLLHWKESPQEFTQKCPRKFTEAEEFSWTKMSTRIGETCSWKFWTLDTSATSQDHYFNLNRVSTFSWIYQLSYENGEGFNYDSPNGLIPPSPPQLPPYPLTDQKKPGSFRVNETKSTFCLQYPYFLFILAFAALLLSLCRY